MPLATGLVVLAPVKVFMVLRLILKLAAAACIPVMVGVVTPVEVRFVIVLLVKLPALLHTIPVTPDAVPVELNALILFNVAVVTVVAGVAIEIPVTAPPPEMILIGLLLTLLVVELPPALIIVIAPPPGLLNLVMVLVETDKVAAAAAPVFVIPNVATEVPALNVIAFVPASPNWLLLILMVVATAAVLMIPVKPPVVAVDVLPLITLSEILSTPEGKELTIHTTGLADPAPLSTDVMLLLLKFKVIPATAADAAEFDWLMASNAPFTVAALLSAMVLLVMAFVKVPVGAVVKSV